MLCPKCGVGIPGPKVQLCDRCQAQEMTVPGPELESETSKPPSPDSEQKKIQHLEDLYRDVLGTSAWEDYFAIITHPLCLILLGLVSFLFVYLVLLFAAPNLAWHVRIFITAGALFYLAYLYCYVDILIQLFYEDRIAFFLCVIGLAGFPIPALRYGEEIGWHRIRRSFAMIAGAIACCAIGTWISGNTFSTLFDIEGLFEERESVLETDEDYDRAIKQLEADTTMPAEWKQAMIKRLRFVSNYPELELYSLDQMQQFSSKMQQRLPQSGMRKYYGGKYEEVQKRQRAALERRFLKKHGWSYRGLSDSEAAALYQQMEHQ